MRIEVNDKTYNVNWNDTTAPGFCAIEYLYDLDCYSMDGSDDFDDEFDEYD